MSDAKANSKARVRYPAIVFAFIATCLAHAVMIDAVAWILHNRVEAIDWDISWRDSSALGTISVVWRMWLRQRN